MTYEYLCTACENVWEAEQSISEPALKICPRCHKETAKRQVSGGAGFILKGGGWYADLYGSSPQKKPEGKSEKSDSSSGDAKTDTKKAAPASGDSGTKKETGKGDGGGGGGGGGGTGSGTKGGADSSAA